MQHILWFYGWWQMAVCLFAFAGLMSIWYHIGRAKRDWGQIFLAFSVLCWSLSGGVEILFVDEVLDQQIAKMLRSLLSLFNSLLILLAFPWFRILPTWISKMVNSGIWYYLIGIPFALAVFLTVRIYGEVDVTIEEPDVWYAVYALFFLGLVLWNTFVKRNLHLLAVLSVLIISVILVVQVLKLQDAEAVLPLLSSIFKTSLIMIFFALALSWVKELGEEWSPTPNKLFLRFNKHKSEKNKIVYQIFMKGITGNQAQEILLSQATYTLLLKFAIKRIEAFDSWLEIKPGGKQAESMVKTFDISDHNEIKRLETNLLNEVYGKGNWADNLHRKSLNKALFERPDVQNRKIRLALPKENITLPIE